MPNIFLKILQFLSYMITNKKKLLQTVTNDFESNENTSDFFLLNYKIRISAFL